MILQVRSQHAPEQRLLKAGSVSWEPSGDVANGDRIRIGRAIARTSVTGQQLMFNRRHPDYQLSTHVEEVWHEQRQIP